MKRIFSKEKFIERMGEDTYQEAFEIFGDGNWIDQCDGLTVEECEKMEFNISEAWIKEIRV